VHLVDLDPGDLVEGPWRPVALGHLDPYPHLGFRHSRSTRFLRRLPALGTTSSSRMAEDTALGCCRCGREGRAGALRQHEGVALLLMVVVVVLRGMAGLYVGYQALVLPQLGAGGRQAMFGAGGGW